MIRAFSIALASALLGICTAPPVRGASAAPVTVDPFPLVTTAGDTIPAELGTIRVPENRRGADRRVIELAFVRLRSTAPRPGSPIVFLAGGPGNSGIDALNGPRLPLFLALRRHGDVIALDQRGVGRSRPSLDCAERLDLPRNRSTDPVDLLRETRRLSRACASRLRSEGVDLSGYNVRESADDLEDLRVGLGAERISLLGLSYGTTLALEAIRRHGDRIDRAVLAGVEGTDDMLKRPARVDRMLAMFDSLAREDREVIVEIGAPLEAIRRVLGRLEATPVRVLPASGTSDSAVVLGSYDIQWFVWKVAASDGLPFFPALAHAMDHGDFRHAAAFVARRLRHEVIDGAMTASTDCASGVSEPRLHEVRASETRSILGDAPNFVYPEVCDAWGSPELGGGFREPVRSDIPVLLISGTLDARTPPDQAEEVRRGLPNSGHLILEGAVHGDPLLLGSPRIREVMLDFLRSGKAADERVRVPFRFLPLSSLAKLPVL